MAGEDRSGHLRSELTWLVDVLREHAARATQRGQQPMGSPLAGLVIQDREASGMLDELAESWGRPAAATGATGPRPGPGHERHRGRLPGERRTVPLLRAADAFDLHLGEYVGVLLALAVEIDGRFGRVVAYLNDHAARTRPTIGLALGISDRLDAPILPVEFQSRPCVRDGLLEVEGEGPIPDLSLRVAPDLLARLTGVSDVDSPARSIGLGHPRRGLLARLVLADGVRKQVESWIELARHSEPPRVTVLVGEPGSGRRTLAHALASELGRAIVWADATPESLARSACPLRRESRWHDAALLMRWSGPPTEGTAAALRSEIEPARAPVFLATTGAEAPAVMRAFDGAPVLDLARPEAGERAQLWTALAPRGAALSPDEGATLAARFRFHPGKIQRASRLAAAQRALRTSAAIGAEDLADAARALARGALEGLAQRLELPYTRDQLVVPAHVAEELSLAVAWITKRKQVMEDWGLGKRIRMGRGLTMLFSGPPGTGKTMAAQVMARELGVDLYRLDLASVMSKYIGETEKNLRRLFQEAEEAGAAVLIDECDVLLSKRAEVRDARDKYANAEVGALLVMLDLFEGVSFMTTNRGGDMDDAMTRRFPFIIGFPPPEEAERKRIWEGLLPREVVESGRVNVAELARVYKLTGGEIKNAVLAGAYAAAREGREMGQGDVVAGVGREMRKKGRGK